MNADDRARAIEDAAYKVLEEKGFKGTSMLAVARAAKASNETMYKWYGDKVGLFSAMIARNADLVETELEASRGAGGQGVDALHAVAEALVLMLTSDRAIALNRAAAADPSGVLGTALAEGGRARVAPMIAALLQEIAPDADDIAERAETFIALLIGDLQIRRVIGAIPALSMAEATARADRAMAQFKVLFPA